MTRRGWASPPPGEAEEVLRRMVEDPFTWYGALYPDPLRPYQLEAVTAAERLVLDCRAGTCSPETQLNIFSRQSGKSTASARLKVRLLAMFAAQGGNVVQSAPTDRPQLRTFRKRFEAALDNELTAGQWKLKEGVYHLARATLTPLSGEPQAERVSETADICLDLDEFQGMSEEVIEKDLQPMTISTGAPTLAWGTVGVVGDLMDRTREYLREREKVVGRRLLFEVDWEQVAECVPRYGEAVQAAIQRLGIDHPWIQTQYLLKAVRQGGKFFQERHLKLMRGDHPRRRSPRDGVMHVAGVDLCGSDELDAAQAAALAGTRDRDSIVVTIAELEWLRWGREMVPFLRIVDHLYLAGMHPNLAEREIAAYLWGVWRVAFTVVDGRGVGEHTAKALEQMRPGQVKVLKSTGSDVNRMGNAMLGMAGTGRIRMYQDDGSEEARQFWLQCRELEREVTPSGGIRFKAPKSRGNPSSPGDEMHDDFPKSLGYCVEAAAPHLQNVHDREFFDTPTDRWNEDQHGYW